jgi:hypothetical protein
VSPAPTDAAGRYVAEVLRLYRATPTVLGRVRRADRALAHQLYEQHIPLYAVSNAFVLGAARRLLHNGFSAPMPPVRSLHYFLPLLREVLDRPPGPREIEQMVDRLRARGADW